MSTKINIQNHQIHNSFKSDYDPKVKKKNSSLFDEIELSPLPLTFNCSRLGFNLPSSSLALAFPLLQVLPILFFSLSSHSLSLASLSIVMKCFLTLILLRVMNIYSFLMGLVTTNQNGRKALTNKF